LKHGPSKWTGARERTGRPESWTVFGNYTLTRELSQLPSAAHHLCVFAAVTILVLLLTAVYVAGEINSTQVQGETRPRDSKRPGTDQVRSLSSLHCVFLSLSVCASALGLPPVPDFPGCPGFVPCCPASRINHSGAHTNERRGPFSHTCSQDFLWGFFLGVHFSSSKKLTTFLVVVTFKPTYTKRSNVKPAWEKIGSWLGAPWRRTGPLPWYSRHNG